MTNIERLKNVSSDLLQMSNLAAIGYNAELSEVLINLKKEVDVVIGSLNPEPKMCECGKFPRVEQNSKGYYSVFCACFMNGPFWREDSEQAIDDWNMGKADA